MTRPAPREWEPAQHGFPVDRLDPFLLWAAGEGASDIAFQTGSPACLEIDGALIPVARLPIDSPTMGERR